MASFHFILTLTFLLYIVLYCIILYHILYITFHCVYSQYFLSSSSSLSTFYKCNDHSFVLSYFFGGSEKSRFIIDARPFARRRSQDRSKDQRRTFTWRSMHRCCRQPCSSSLAEERPGCLATHRPERSSRPTAVCSTPRRCGSPTEGDAG